MDLDTLFYRRLNTPNNLSPISQKDKLKMKNGPELNEESTITNKKYSFKLNDREIIKPSIEKKPYNPRDYSWGSFADTNCLNYTESETVFNCAPQKPLPKVVSFTAFQEGAKKKKYKPSYICTIHCKYDIVRQIASKLGMRESVENWNVLWSDYTVSCERVKNLKRYQKVNHFPGMVEICRKDLLARNLNRMHKLFPNQYDFYPRTWLLPTDYSEVVEFSKNNKYRTFILKPDVGCKGKGIQLTKTTKGMAGMERTICQEYVSKPYLVNGYKFDLRVYALLTSCDPLRLYVYNEGLVRFATKHYTEPNRTNLANMYMHLTNYSVNKFSRTYLSDPDIGSKRKITTLNELLRRQCHDVLKLWREIDDMIIKTVFLALPTLQHNYRAAFPSVINGKACFEILGFDFIFDRNLKPYLLEVNHSPSLHTDAPIDREVKEALLIDTFKILNLQKNIKNKIIQEDRQMVTNRLLKDLTSTDWVAKNIPEISPDQEIKMLDSFELENIGNYRKIYPGDESEKYDVFYCQGTSSLFHDTFASRAREKAVKLSKESQDENEMTKLVQRASLRMHLRSPDKNSSYEWIMNKIKRDRDNLLHSKENANPKKIEPALDNSGKGCKTGESEAPSTISCSALSLKPISSKPDEGRRIRYIDQKLSALETLGALEKIHTTIKKCGQLRLLNEIKRVRKNNWSNEDRNGNKRMSLQHSLIDIIKHLESHPLLQIQQEH